MNHEYITGSRPESFGGRHWPSGRDELLEIEKCPISAYLASPPVIANTTTLMITMNPSCGKLRKKSKAYTGWSKRNTFLCWDNRPKSSPKDA